MVEIIATWHVDTKMATALKFRKMVNNFFTILSMSVENAKQFSRHSKAHNNCIFNSCTYHKSLNVKTCIVGIPKIGKSKFKIK